MIRYLIVLFIALTLAACQKGSRPPEVRKEIRLDDLVIEVHDQGHQFMLSDKRGGFIIGNTGSNENAAGVRWSVNGRDLLAGYDIRVGDTLLDSRKCELTRVCPDRVQKLYEGGIIESLSPLEFSDSADDHAVLVSVQLKHQGTISFDIEQAIGFTLLASNSPTGFVTLKEDGGQGEISIFGGEHGTASVKSITVQSSPRADFLVVFSRAGISTQRARGLYERMETLQEARTHRMERLLNSAYLKTSDEKFDKAAHWVQLSLDALIVEAKDTFAVAGLPWDGSLNGRDNVRSILGISLAKGEHQTGAAIIRMFARYQDTVGSHPTFGRIADRVRGGVASYTGADVAPWFFREMYEHVTTTNDTALLLEMYPLIKRSMEGSLKYHADSMNFLVHGDGETWMADNAVHRGDRAAEVQLLWYFQQLISSFVATHARDFDAAQRWGQLASRTAKNFSQVFVDTVNSLVYDHLASNGRGVHETRPNALFCLEIVGSEIVEQNVVKQTFNALAYPHGVGLSLRRTSDFIHRQMDPTRSTTVPCGRG